MQQQSPKQKSIPSIETQKLMHAFFMQTSAPRIFKEELKGRDDNAQTQ